MAGNRTLKLSILADVDNLKKNLDSGSKEVEGFGGKLEKFGKVAAAAFAAAAAAAAAYAVKLAVDGVKAAIEDEAAQNRLANALRNVTGATEQQIAAVEDQILQMSLAFGVADDQLRPAYQRLALATGNLTEAEEGLQLALDISAATGKSVEQVANALGKAYEGNTGALGRLGIGLSAAEIKSLGLDGTMKQLAETFGGAATTQANTLEGRIARLRVTFDETVESIGQGLLPIVERFIGYITERFIPMIMKARQEAIEPITRAFENNREEMDALYRFGKDFLVPFFEFTLVNAIRGAGKAVGTIIEIISAAIRGIENLVNAGIAGINLLIDAYNRLPFGDIDRLNRVNFNPNTSTSGRITTSTGSINIPTPYVPPTTTPSFGGATGGVTGGATGGTTTSAGTTGTGTANRLTQATNELASAVTQLTSPNWMPNLTGSVANWRARESGDIINTPPTVIGAFDPARFRAAEEGNITIVVQAPSVIDQNGFASAVVDALNQTQRRTGGGAGALIGTAQAL